jgi:probable rRNA maturation factor
MNLKNHEIDIINDDNLNIPSNLEDLVISILHEEKIVEEKIVTISFVDENGMKDLYQQYYGYAQSTDVLSFVAGEIDPSSGKEILGDIIICYPFVVQQSNKLGNQLFSEIQLMVIHGMLHLLGYDHTTDDQKLQMWQRQNDILRSNRIMLNQLPE